MSRRERSVRHEVDASHDASEGVPKLITSVRRDTLPAIVYRNPVFEPRWQLCRMPGQSRDNEADGSLDGVTTFK